MLESLRRGAGSWVAKFFLLLLVVSFGFWGIADRINNYGGDTVATVGSREISGNEFQHTYRNQLDALTARFGRNISQEEARAFGIPQQVLSSMIAGSVLDQEAARLGLGLPDKAVVERIMSERQFQGVGGKFNDQAFQRALREMGLTEQGFAAQEKRNALREQLLDLVESAPAAPRALLQALNTFQNEERILQYFVIPEAESGKIDDPAEDALKSYYNDHKDQFTAPQYRKMQALALTPETQKNNIKVSDEDIKGEYESNKDKYREPEQREIQQISFPNAAAAKAAKEKLDQGADFMAVASDAGFKEGDVNLGLVAKSALVDPKVADAAFSIEKDKVSDAIEGAFSSALIRVTKIVPPTNKSLDDVKDSLRSAMALQRAGDELPKLYDKIEDERAAGTSLAEISKKFSIPLFEAATDQKGRAADGTEADLHGYNRDLLKPLFETGVGVENPALRVGGGKGYVWYDLVEIVPQRLKPLDEVREAAVNAWRDNEMRSRLTKKSQELIAQGATTSEDFGALAKSVNAEVKTTKPLKRAAVEPGLTMTTVKQAFGLKEGALAGAPATGSKSRVVFRIEKVISPKDLDDAATAAARKRLENEISGDMVGQYVAGLQHSYGVKINDRTFRSAVGGELPEPRSVHEIPDVN